MSESSSTQQKINFSHKQIFLQSMIDIFAGQISQDQAKQILNDGITELLLNKPYDEIAQLINLLILISKKFPNVSKTFSNTIKKLKLTPNLLVFSFVNHSGKFFSQDLLKQIIPQLEESKQTINIYGIEISKITAVFLAVNALMNSKLRENTIKKCFLYLVKEEYEFSIVLLYKAQQQNLLYAIPNEIFLNVFKLDKNLKIIGSLLPYFSKDLFESIYHDLKSKILNPNFFYSSSLNKKDSLNSFDESSHLELEIPNNKEITNIAVSIITKIDSFNLISPEKANDVIGFLEFCNPDDINWKSLFKKFQYQLELGTRFVSKYSNYKIDPITFSIMHPDPCSIIPAKYFMENILFQILSMEFDSHFPTSNLGTDISNTEFSKKMKNKILKSFFKNSPN